MRGQSGLKFVVYLASILAVLATAIAVKASFDLKRMQARVDEVVNTAVQQAAADSGEKMESMLQELEEERSRSEAGRSRDLTVKSIAHRGVSGLAPENTLPAFRLAAEHGFSCVETDIRFTADGVPVCLHDSSIDRTSNGTGDLSQMTFDEVRRYDFGAWKSAEFAGTRIPAFEEFIGLCKSLGLHPYIELKEGTTEQIRDLVETVNRYGMRGMVSWISFDRNLLNAVRWSDDEARLGLLLSKADTGAVHEIAALRSGKNLLFLSTCVYSDELVRQCRNADLPLEVWVVNDETLLEEMDPYVTGVTSNGLNYGQFLYQKGMNNG